MFQPTNGEQTGAPSGGKAAQLSPRNVETNMQKMSLQLDRAQKSVNYLPDIYFKGILKFVNRK